MATFTKEVLSGSVQGRPVDVTDAVSPGTVIHTTGVAADETDEVWLYAANNDPYGDDLLLTIEFGGTTTADTIAVEVPFEDGLTLLVPGLPLTGDGSSGAEVRAFGPAGLSVSGYVNRIAP